ncbi:MAG: 2-alkenal reductase, partial [Polaromonas sp.]|nr:2-alkenal reductase [Polaromonas sp.]
MKRIWLLFSQAVTVLAAAYFVVATLQPQWLHRGVGANAVSVIEAPAGSVQPSGAGASHTGGFASAARVASSAVVSINTSKAASRSAQADDPWFKFFFGDQGSGEAQAGLGSG